MARYSGHPGACVRLLGDRCLRRHVVNVELWDKGGDTPMATGVAYATPGLDLSKATMGMKLSRKSAPAGRVTFHVTNSSKDQIHEMIVMYLQDPTKPLPYVENENRVDEDKAGDKGEVSELDPATRDR